MCGQIRQKNSRIAPGNQVEVITSHGKQKMTWGLLKGQIYNSRSERLSSYWKTLSKNKCLIPAETFIENSKEFPLNDKFLAGIFNPKTLECSILTEPAIGEVKKVHHRMPVLVTEDYLKKY